MDLNNLVPSLELCRKIPTGVFEDSYAWYCWSYIDQKYLLCVGGKPDVRLFRDPCPCGMKYFYPAPTLKEILRKIYSGDIGIFCVHAGGGNWYLGDCEHDLYVNNGYEGKNPEDLALKWWLKLNKK